VFRDYEKQLLAESQCTHFSTPHFRVFEIEEARFVGKVATNSGWVQVAQVTFAKSALPTMWIATNYLNKSCQALTGGRRIEDVPVLRIQ
jgi:hypothetical protein